MAKKNSNQPLLILVGGLVLVLAMITGLTNVDVDSMLDSITSTISEAAGGSSGNSSENVDRGKSSDLSGSLGDDIAAFLKNPESLALPPELPGVLLTREGFIVVYSMDYMVPLWVGYELTGEEVEGDLPREDGFRKDPELGSDAPSSADYTGTGYDRGHMIPAADAKWSQDAMEDSFLMSNVVPQIPELNRGSWKDLEEAIRNLALDEKSLIVITGPVIADKEYPVLGDSGVIVPEYFFKVILDYSEPGVSAWGFIFPNREEALEGRKYSDFMFSIDQVEQYTGYDFFAPLPDEMEDALEKSKGPVF